MVLFVAGDIGGTNSRFQLLRATRHANAADSEAGQGEVVVAEHIYPSRQYPTIEEVITLFLRTYNPKREPVYCMCLAVAGPANNNRASVTNLPWVIDGVKLAKTFQMQEVSVINDFVGIGYGLLALEASDLETVYAGSPPVAGGVKAVIGAGTGLGECFLTNNGSHYDVWPAEGSHADFAPRDLREFEIMEYIKRKDGIERVSIERATSGLGLPRIYEYLSSKAPGRANAEAAALIAKPGEDPGRHIAEYARANACPVCVETMDVFVRLYGAEAGNLALKTLPYGGLYIAGGIAAKNMAAMRKNQQFVQHYLAKGRLRAELEKIPIYLITHPQVGLLGSKVLCRRIINRAENWRSGVATPQLQAKL